MKAIDIDLEQEPKEESEQLAVTPGEKEADETVESPYPHFHFESPTPLNIPPKGTMQVEYEVVLDKDSEDGGYLYKVDLYRITGVEGKGAKPVKTEEALDQLAMQKSQENQNVQS